MKLERLGEPSTDSGQDSILISKPAIYWDNWVQSQRFVVAVLQICATFYFGESDARWIIVSTKCIDDDASQLAISRRVPRKAEEQPTQQRCRGVSASKENVEELGT